MIGIIGAMDIEVEKIKAFLSDVSEEVISGVNFVRGKFAEKDIVVAKCGVGKVFSALCAEAMILKYSPELIVNVGVAGCLDKTLKIGDIVIADSVCQHDMDTSPLGEPLGFIGGIDMVKIPCDIVAAQQLFNTATNLGCNTKLGTIASGDQFLNSDDAKKRIVDNFGAIAGEMEGASIGHVAYANGTPFAVLRVISDNASGDSNMDFPQFCQIAAEKSINICKEFASNYNK